MAQPRLAMRTIKDMLRLHLQGGVTSCRRIGRALGCGKTAAAQCLRRAAGAGLMSWEAVAALEQRFYPAPRRAGAGPVGHRTGHGSARIWHGAITNYEKAIELGELKGPLPARGEKVREAMGTGELTPTEADQFLGALGRQAQLQVIADLEDRIHKLEAHNDPSN